MNLITVGRDDLFQYTGLLQPRQVTQPKSPYSMMVTFADGDPNEGSEARRAALKDGVCKDRTIESMSRQR